MSQNRSSGHSPRSSSSHASPTSFIRKLAHPFANKQHTQIRHEIELDEPFKAFAPGDSVKGSVNIDVAKPTRVTHLVIRLHGLVKVITHSKLPGEPIPYDEHLLNNSKGRRGKEYFGNGFAKLFEDEHVLCGDGRLLGQYIFRFELLLPRRGLPSSIDFENGTITYLLSSSLTRATTIAPVLTKEQKIKVRETIDVGLISPPRPQVISLEAVKKKRQVMQRMRRSSSQHVDAMTPTKDSRTGSLDERASIVSGPPGSPVPSEVSFASFASAGTTSQNTNTAGPRAVPDQQSASATTLPSITASNKTITAETEILYGGCLPGDTLPIRVTVEHTRPIKTMQGIIITMYRLAHIDVAPAIPLGPTSKNGKLKYEDVYPKSRTGLGGLSLTSAGSSRTFRQDIAQNITPLIVHPTTLSTVIKTSIQVPDHLFPTITGVPGAMISFRYFIEVVIDLRGRLGQDRLLRKFDMIDMSQHSYGEASVSMKQSPEGVTFLTTPGFNFLVTDQIRRQKGIVHTRSEIVLGTIDSTRSRRNDQVHSRGGSQSGDLAIRDSEEATQPPYAEADARLSINLSAPLPPMPPISIPDEPMDEKSRIRRAEQTLLPSAPLESGEGSSSVDYAVPPSAPTALDHEDLALEFEPQGYVPAYSGPSSQASGTWTNGLNIISESQSHPLYESSSSAPKPIPQPAPTDDKQELERQRLLASVSSPDDPPGIGEDVLSTRLASAPKAPDTPLVAPTLESSEGAISEEISRVETQQRIPSDPPESLEFGMEVDGEDVGTHLKQKAIAN